MGVRIPEESTLTMQWSITVKSCRGRENKATRGTKMRRENTVNVRAVVYQAFLGFLFGFALLHPISMVIFHWLDPRLAHGMPGASGGGALAAVLHSFTLSMLPMGIVYGLLAGLSLMTRGTSARTCARELAS